MGEGKYLFLTQSCPVPKVDRETGLPLWLPTLVLNKKQGSSEISYKSKEMGSLGIT